MKVTKGQKKVFAVIAAILIGLVPESAFAGDLPFALMQEQSAKVGSAAQGPAMELPATLPADGKPMETEEPGVRHAVVLCDTNYRKMPSETAVVTGQANIGDPLDIYAVNVNGAWDAVLDENGQMVYIHSSAVSISAPTYAKDDPSDIHITDGGANGYPGELYNDKDYLALINEAKKYIGFPYVFGGSTPETSFDCSGFVCWSLNHSGFYQIERTDAQSLYNHCTEISREEARPGDLIFFQGTYETPNTVTHVAIYVGNGYMLHAGKPIGYSSFETPYWQQHFYAFGRLDHG